MIGKTIDQIQVGDSASFTKTVSETDIYLFAGITGDFNPAHVNKAYAENSVFKARIAHGMLTAAFISTVLGMYLPGPGTIYVEQHLTFVAPVYVGDTVTARIEVIEVLREKKRVRVKTVCSKSGDVVVLEGEAVVIPPRPPKS